MAKAKSEFVYNNALTKLKATHLFCATWLDDRKYQFASHILRGRRGIVTTNPVEQFNNTMLQARAAPISDALLMLINKMGSQAVVRKNQGMKWKNDGLNFVPTVQSSYEANLADGLTRQVIIRQCNLSFSPIVVGDVCKPGPVPDINSMLKVEIRTDSGKIKCGCNFRVEHGIPCLHAIALIHAVGLNSAEPLWFDSGLTVDSYINEYDASPISLGNIKLHSSNTTIIEPDHRIVKCGRPKKKKRVVTTGTRFCPGCNETGHFLMTCPKINIGTLYGNMMYKVEDVITKKFDEWDGKINPEQYEMTEEDDFSVSSSTEEYFM